jgi:hypothetical protein
MGIFFLVELVEYRAVRIPPRQLSSSKSSRYYFSGGEDLSSAIRDSRRFLQRFVDFFGQNRQIFSFFDLIIVNSRKKTK